MKRISILLSALAVLICISVCLTPSKAKRTQKKAFTALQAHDFINATQAIQSCDNLETASYYLGAISFAKEAYPEALHYFRKARKDLNQSMIHAPLVADTFFFEAAIAYLQHENASFISSIELLEPLYPDNLWLLFFKGLKAHMQGNYKESQIAFEHVQNTQLEKEKGSWLNAVLTNTFSHSWLEMHIAHALIENGHIEEGKQRLETELHQMRAQDEAIQDAGALYLGYAYLKKAALLPLEKRDSTYKLALFYFESVSRESESLLREKALVTHLLMQEFLTHGDATLTRDSSDGLVPSLFGFITLLDKWGDRENLQIIADLLGELILKTETISQNSLSYLCFNLIDNPLIKDRLFHRLYQTLKETVRSGAYEKLNHIKYIASELGFSMSGFDTEVATCFAAQLPRLIALDSHALDETKRALNYWKEFESDKQRAAQLALHLLQHSKRLWSYEGAEEKATNLMHALLSTFPNYSFRGEIETFLRTLYCRAECSNTRSRMCNVLDALDRFNMPKDGLVTEEKLANTLADTEYLLCVHNYPQAQIHANWILKTNPSNQKALNFMALALLHQGDYSKAYAYLVQIKEPHTGVEQALLLCQALEEQHVDTCLAHVEDLSD